MQQTVCCRGVLLHRCMQDISPKGWGWGAVSLPHVDVACLFFFSLFFSSVFCSYFKHKKYAILAVIHYANAHGCYFSFFLCFFIQCFRTPTHCLNCYSLLSIRPSPYCHQNSKFLLKESSLKINYLLCFCWNCKSRLGGA